MHSILKRNLPGLVVFLALLGSCLPANSTELKSTGDIESLVLNHSQSLKITTIAPHLLLLKQYESGQDISGWLMSEKLDGVRAYWNGRQLLSRSGKGFTVPDWFTDNFPPFELDGELWIGRNQFEQTISTVNKQTPHNGWQAITYQVFELPNQGGGLLERMNVLNLYLKNFPAPYLRVVEQVAVSDELHLQTELLRVLGLGGEGLVVRNPQSLYHAGRSSEALKVKLKQDAECQVKGYTPGKGKYLNQVGALLCEVVEGQLPDFIQHDDRLFKIGSGLSDSQRLQPPKIGEIVTFQYIGLTQKGLPKFPVFLRVREDL